MKNQKFSVVMSHGSRTEACIAACNQVAKEKGVILNHPDFIGTASNKVKTKELIRKLGYQTTNWQLAMEDFRLKFPVVAKLKSGSGGEGMVLIGDQRALDVFRSENTERLNRYFYEEMFNPRSNLKNHFNTTREFRFHVSPWLMGTAVTYTDITDEGENVGTHTINNGVIFAVKKVLREELSEKMTTFGKNISTGNAYFTRNLGDILNNENSVLYNTVLDEVIGLVNSLQLDYAAVDVLICPSRKEWCILEVNTAPGFGDGGGVTAGRYSKALEHIILAKHEASLI
jgi:D-alanine-D-alanine ligase-like ATP-grasp enzyme